MGKANQKNREILMLKVENVTKRYGKVVANDNISFQVDKDRSFCC